MRFATYLSPSVDPVYRLVAERIGQALDEPTELRRGQDYESLARGEHDVAFLCSPPYLALADRAEPAVELLAAPVLIGERYGDRPVYFSDVIVRADAPFERFEDLRGRSWAFNEESSYSGYGATRARLATMGEVRGFFGAIVRAGFHQRAVRMVAAGDVDAAAIDSQVLEIEMRDHPGLAAHVRVVDSMGPAPIQPVVASRMVPADVRERIRAALCALHGDPAARETMATCLVQRFDPVGDRDYDAVRSLLALADSTGMEGFGTRIGPGASGI